MYVDKLDELVDAAFFERTSNQWPEMLLDNVLDLDRRLDRYIFGIRTLRKQILGSHPMVSSLI
jgi:hypothetical protein